MTRGRNRASHRGRDCCTAEDHQAAGKEDDFPAIDSGDEDRA